MPREVKAFACQWNCHRNVLTSALRMAVHEELCNWNPKNKACITCRYFSPGGGRDEDHEPAGCEQGFDIREKLKNHCEGWSELL